MTFSQLVAKVAVAYRAGAWRAIRCRVDRLWLSGLRRVLRFDAWHANAPYSCRPYKEKVVELANALRPVTVVEVGCGLGDILSRIEARERFGIDTDAAVVRAARCLHPFRARWVHGDISSIARCTPPGLEIDCLIMVNWIHNLSAEQLQACLLPLLPRVGYLILDAIDLDAPASYRFRHDFAFLRGVTERISIAREAGEPRSFVVFKVMR